MPAQNPFHAPSHAPSQPPSLSSADRRVILRAFAAMGAARVDLPDLSDLPGHGMRGGAVGLPLRLTLRADPGTALMLWQADARGAPMTAMLIADARGFAVVDTVFPDTGRIGLALGESPAAWIGFDPVLVAVVLAHHDAYAGAVAAHDAAPHMAQLRMNEPDGGLEAWVDLRSAASAGGIPSAA